MVPQRIHKGLSGYIKFLEVKKALFVLLYVFIEEEPGETPDADKQQTERWIYY
jgi:hypothetical protein